MTKSKFDNKYGCRHSLVDGINRATDVLIGGKVAVVCGYGDVGKGCAESLRRPGRPGRRHRDRPHLRPAGGHGGLPGHRRSRTSSPTADIFVTATGNKDIITAEHMAQMKHQAIVGNIGHFDNEIDMAGLAATPGIERVNIKPQVDKWVFPDGHAVIVLSEGRLLNLGNATGHPSFVMSNSFTNQTMAQIELFTKTGQYENKVYVLPKHLDEKVARLHLDALGVKLTTLTQRAGRLHRRAGGRPLQARHLPLLSGVSPAWRWRRTVPLGDTTSAVRTERRVDVQGCDPRSIAVPSVEGSHPVGDPVVGGHHAFDPPSGGRVGERHGHPGPGPADIDVPDRHAVLDEIGRSHLAGRRRGADAGAQAQQPRPRATRQPPRRRAPSAGPGRGGARAGRSDTPIRSKSRNSNPTGGSSSGATCTTVSAARESCSSSSAQRGHDSTCDRASTRSRPVSTPSASSASSREYRVTSTSSLCVAHRWSLTPSACSTAARESGSEPSGSASWPCRAGCPPPR